MKKKITVLTWMATKNDPYALKSLLANLGKDYDIVKVLYIYQKGLIASNKDAREKFEGAKKVYPLTTIPVSVKDPTDLNEIFDIVKGKIVPMVQNEDNLVINLSSGTPTMHAVWLLLFGWGNFPTGTKLISSQIKRETGETTCDDVEFPIKTLFTELRKYEEENPNKPFYKIDAKTETRKEVQEKIKVYSEFPNVPILLLGERGIGKSTMVETYIAKAKGNKTVTSLVCGSLNSNLLESKLFGHKKGAFTGATKDEDGLLKIANNGILFLDEIQDMPKHVQRMLLQTLQTHKYRVLGDTKEKETNIELVCASNLPESELRHRLDPDFYDRIAVFKVTLPPLRECRKDLLEDWEEVWNVARPKNSKQEAPMDPALKKFLMTSSLPGNFRTLEKLAYHILAWQGKKTIKEILEEMPPEEDASDNNPESVSLDEFCEMPWNKAVDRFQHMLAEYSCRKYGTQKLAAEKQNCTPRTLQYALKK
jgi:DNA-binding NtrC family response regulator